MDSFLYLPPWGMRAAALTGVVLLVVAGVRLLSERKRVAEVISKLSSQTHTASQDVPQFGKYVLPGPTIRIRIDLQLLQKRFGKGKALSILAHKLGRAVYFMLRRGKAFDRTRFLATVN